MARKYGAFQPLLYLILLSLFITPVMAQQQQAIKDLVESLSTDLTADFDLSELIDQLQHYTKHPIDLNKTSAEELKTLVLLSPLQISNFFSHVAKNGALLDISELQAIPAFDSQTIQNIMPFVTLRDNTAYKDLRFKNLVHQGNHDLIFRFAQTLQQQKGFQDLPGSRYLGSPEKLLTKYRYTYDKLLSLSLVGKKDAGEELFRGSNAYNFDFSSVSLAIYQMGRIQKLVIGDYSLQFGQGLTLWSGFGFGKGPDVTGVAKNDVGLKTYTSTNETSFFRGLAGTVALLNHLQFTPFVSYRKIDASQTLQDDGQLTQVNISSSGLHRTKSELSNQKSLGQLVYGGALQYLSNNLAAGIVGYQSHYESAFHRGTQAYNAKGFEGKDLTNVGLHYNYTFRNIYFFGEAAKSLSSGMAFVNGAMASLSPKTSVVLVNRHSDTDYHNFFAQASGENSDASNESSWYAGIHYAPTKHWTGAVYADVFKFPWLKYRVNDASKGYELMTQLLYRRDKTFSAVARFKIKQNQQNTDLPVDLKYLDDVTKQNYRMEVNWRISKKINLQNRLELCQFKKGSAPRESGYLAYQDVDYSPLSSKLSANVRLAYFNTASYNSRVYAYEDDVLYGFSFGMYNGKGARTYINVKYKLLKGMDIWARYALFIYQDAETVGSGLDEIQGNKKSEFKLQLRYQI